MKFEWDSAKAASNLGKHGVSFDEGATVFLDQLAVSGPDLYAGGYFTTAGGAPANRVAKWNGTTWSALGTGLDDNVDALAVSGTDLYVAGRFSRAGGVPANNVAKWTGTTWSALGTGLDGAASALAVSGTDVYVGGGFITAGGVPANNVAKWNGTAWSALGTGVNGFGASALAVSGSDVYVGGNFNMAGGVAANCVAKWNGTAWSALGTGDIGAVVALAVGPNGQLYAGGFFTTVGDGSKVTAYFGIYDPSVVSGLPAATSALAGGLLVWPNPAPGLGAVQVQLNGAAPGTITLDDALGRRVRTQAIAAPARTAWLDLTGLTPGVYFVRSGGAARRLVVE